MSEVYHELAAFVETFGARPATSERERRAREYLARQLQAHGIRTLEQPFRSIPSLTPPWLTVSLLFAASGALAFSPAPGVNRAILLGCAALGSLLACLLYWGLVSAQWDVTRFFPQRASANLIGIVPARRTPTRRVVLMAHIDTQRAMLLWHPKRVRQFGQSFIVQTVLLALHGVGALVLAYGLIAGGTVLGWARWLMLPGSLLSLWGIFVLLHREWVLDWVQGANDNGSGVAVVLTLLKELAHQPLEEVEVWGVFTGCEEVGVPAGAFAFEREYGAALRDALFIIVDHVGRGEPRYLLQEAMLPRQRAHPQMVRLMQQLAQQHPDWCLKPSAVPPGAYTDALPFLMKGYRAVALWCEELPGIPPNWHWTTDVLENVRPTDLERAKTVVRAILAKAIAE
jgi:hypothetical protein